MKKFIVVLVMMLVLVGCGSIKEQEQVSESEKKEEMNNIVSDSSRVRSVEAYADAIETAVVTYLTLNPDLVAGDNFICSSSCNDNCVIDATSSAHDQGTATCNNAKKAIIYSGSVVKCDSVIYDESNGVVTLEGCQVGDYAETTYSGDTMNGFEAD